MKTIYEITTNSELNDGTGYEIGTGIFFEDYESAISFTQSNHYKEFAVMGVLNERNKSYIKKRIVYTKFYEYTDYKKTEKIKNALIKLTEEEKELLGVSKLHTTEFIKFGN